MEIVADKLRKAEDLNNQDLRVWATYNFLAFPEDEQAKIKQLSERQQWFYRRMSLLTPPLFYGIYAITKYQLQSRSGPALLVSICGIFGLIKLGLYSSNKEIDRNNTILYEKFKDEVQHPKYRGLKL